MTFIGEIILPRYSMVDILTNEEFELDIKYSELKEYLEKNTNVKQVFRKFPGTVDPVRIGVRKTDEGFRDALREVASHHKKNTINI
jgi:hypothetical protein